MTNILSIDDRSIFGVAFDLEGTIVDLEPYHWAAHVATAASLGVMLDLDDPRTFTELVPHLIGGPDKAVMENILALARQQEKWKEVPTETENQTLRKMLETKQSLYRTNLHDLDTIPLRDGFREFYYQLQNYGIPISIGSLTDTEDAKIILEKSGLDQLFLPDAIVLKEDVDAVKPDPEVYIKTAERMKIDPRNQLVFEDSHNGVIAAREAGSVALGIPTIDQPAVIKRLRAAGALEVFTGWRDLGGALFGSKEGRNLIGVEGKPGGPRERR